ncbi:MAG: Gfo/Idh/MocA family oxidoreductase [Chloroflexi bacterium]|nr:Gfo/Idh/MocA family oxidoreductase [Chloroflexota bacterium]
MKRCLMIGAGGMAGYWIRGVFPAFKDRVRIVGLVDVQKEPLTAGAQYLDLPAECCFDRLEEAFERTEADFCTIVIPPAFHEAAVMKAVERRMPILSEKPISDTWDACCRIYRAVTGAGLKMQVVQNYRFTPRIHTLKSVIDDGALGRLHYIIARFAADYRERGAWGAFRHEIPHSLLVEGSVHHFDQIRNLSSGDCAAISGWEWNPPNNSFDGESVGLYTLRMTNNVHASYEGNCLEGGTQNSWHDEFYRAECEGGAAILDRDGVVRVIRHVPRVGMSVQDVAPVRRKHEGHPAILEQFLDWLDDGPAPPTVLEDNIRSAAVLFGAIRASQTGQVVNVQHLLDDLN